AERDVLVRAPVAEGVDVVAEADERERRETRDLDPYRLTVGEVGQGAGADALGAHRPASASAWSARARSMSPCSSGRATGTGSPSRTSSKNPPTIRRSATSGGTPRAAR